MKVLVAAVVVIVAACIGTASSEPAVQKTESAWTEMLPVVTAGVCDAGTMNLDTKGHHPLGHESNINFEISTDKKAQLDFYWKDEVGLTVQNTPEAVVLEGFNSHTVFKGTNYSVKQIRFHSQSQVEVNSQPAAMDAEVVHKSAEGKAFVLVILFDKGAAKNAALEKMPWDRVQNAHSKATAHQAINIDYLLPKTWAYYHYLGALKGSGSDAECSQQVPYVVMHYRSVLTQAQLNQFPASSKYKVSSRQTKTPAIMYNQFFFAAMHQPQDCLVGAWGAHGACSKSCGGGTKSRTRTLTPPKHGGAECSQSTTSTTTCNTQACPINCVMASWQGWGSCSKSCATGVKRRVRAVQTQPQHGGVACPTSSGSATCNPQACPVNCVVSAWRGWNHCSRTCGTGTQTTSRTVVTPAAHGGVACPSLQKSQQCNTFACPVHCTVSRWGGWAACSRTCGGGTQGRSRTVTQRAAHGGIACPSLSSSQVCNTHPCPIHCQVSSWAGWASCSRTCGGGSQQRTRQITQHAAHGGNGCANRHETRQCNSHACPVNCVVSSWHGWGGCNRGCGTGQQSRHRSVTVLAAHGGRACPSLSSSQNCNTHHCPVHCAVGGWGGWGGCSRSCGTGSQTRSRGVTRHAAHGGNACPGLSERRNCNTHGCHSHHPHRHHPHRHNPHRHNPHNHNPHRHNPHRHHSHTPHSHSTGIETVGNYRCNKGKRFVHGTGYHQWSGFTNQGGEAGRAMCRAHYSNAQKPNGWWYQFYSNGHFNCAVFSSRVTAAESSWEGTHGRPEEVCVPR